MHAGHTCTVNERWAFRDHATSNVVGGMVRHRYGTGGAGGPRPGGLRDIMMNDHSVPITYWKAWKSREFAMDQGTGNADASYLGLPAYLKQLAIANPGTIVSLETTPAPDGAQRFKYLFLSYSASVQGYPFMRNVVIIDGTHLKGKFTGCLLTASAQDGNNHIFPIGFGIVDSENDEAWTWFFTNLLSVVPDSEALVFVSDRHNSIYSGIRKIYPMAKHCTCLLHLQRNIQTIFKKKHLLYLIARAARAYRVEDFYLHFNQLKVIDIACADYLIRIGLEHWSRSHFEGKRYNIMTSNLAESLNAELAEARGYPIVPLLEYIRTMVVRWFSTRRSAAAGNVNALTPNIAAMITRNFAIATGFKVRHLINSEYEIRENVGVYNRVDLDRKTCSCREFDTLSIPCTHAVAASVTSKRSVESLVADEYRNSYWEMAYSGTIYPVTTATNTPADHGNEVDEGMILLPPSTRRPPGRPRKTRTPSSGEIRVITFVLHNSTET
ncbi:hypothetical protein Bca4012_020895 [Brassica carinata]